MKIIKSFIFFAAAVLVIFFNSCDDSGQNPVFVQKGLVSFSHINLKPLDPNIDGLYTLWIGIDSSGTTLWQSLGSFNISAAGQIIDAQGNGMVFTYAGDTNMLDNAKYSTVVLGSDPLGTVLISCALSVNGDSVTGTLWIADDRALGEIGKRIVGSGYSRASGMYHLSTPTTNNAECNKGIWFCDSLGGTLFSDGLALAPGNGWVWEGWINDESTNTYYSTGRFYDPYSADFDGAGPCAGSSGPPYGKPGQDWITSGGTCPSITALTTGNFGVFISIEPENEVIGNPAYLSPFFLKIFYQNNISNTLGCKVYDNLFNQDVIGRMPKGFIKITN